MTGSAEDVAPASNFGVAVVPGTRAPAIIAKILRFSLSRFSVVGPRPELP